MKPSHLLHALALGLLARLVFPAAGNGPGPWSNSHTSSSVKTSQLLGPAASLGRRSLLAAAGSACGPLTRELVQRVARENTVMVTAIDKLAWKTFGPTFVENIQAAKITYWLIAALDPETSVALGELGITNCFNPPTGRLKYTGTDTNYHWGSHHWSQTTWNKVHLVRAVYELGFHVLHSDGDVVWFRDPLPFFLAQLGGPAHIIISIDALSTHNPAGEVAVEFDSSPYTNINTGIYFVRQWPGGVAFFDTVWLPMQDRHIGHDQDGFNWVVRGSFFREGITPAAIIPEDTSLRVFYAAFSNTTAVAFLPPSMFGNTYTYVNARLWQRLSHPLYAVHWVWGGRTMESKRQDMRDAMKFHDEPSYYTEPYLLSFDLDQLQMPPDYNSWRGTEEMIRFHVAAANYQLQQAYFALAAALITNRTLVMPRFLCYCSKNWYQTQQCRINEETVTQFPFVCSLSQLLRSKRLAQGFGLPPGSPEYGEPHRRVFIREYSFLDNPKVPDLIKTSFLEVVPSDSPRDPALRPDEPLVLSEEPATRGYGRRITVVAPLSDGELGAVLGERGAYPRARIVHLPRPGAVLSGFRSGETWRLFDQEIQKVVAYWCCRTPPDMVSMNLTDKVQLVALPPHRYPHLPAIKGSTYLHLLGPINRPEGADIK